MFKSKLKAFVKNSKLFYKLYYICGSFLIRFVGMFVKTDPNLILFSSYGGRKYDDSPRVVYEYLLKNPISPEHKYVWGFIEPKYYPEVEKSVKIDTFSYYIIALKAGYWITNTSITRGLNFKKKKTKNILFQHGMVGIKRIFTDALDQRNVFVSGFYEKYDMVFVEGKNEIPILKRVWQLDESTFHITGLPRNDNLVNYPPEERIEIKNRLGIPLEKKVILYAPTFRDYYKAEDGCSALHIPIDFGKWGKILGDEYVLLVTAHYEVAKLLDTLPRNGFVINAFGYPQINDLMKVADLLISDYSSIVFDYAILERPILCYGYDYERFSAVRGTYTDINKLFYNGVIRDEDTLLNTILNMDYEAQCAYTQKNIKETYLAAYGDSARKAVEIIFAKTAEK